MAALASNPGGSWSVKSFVESPPLGLNVMSVPRFPVEAAGAEVGLRVRPTVPSEAPAAGAMAAIAPTTTAHRAIRRLIVARYFPAGLEPNPCRRLGAA
jgi:hypothetical protein